MPYYQNQLLLLLLLEVSASVRHGQINLHYNLNPQEDRRCSIRLYKCNRPHLFLLQHST